jgi:hypothetical protein
LSVFENFEICWWKLAIFVQAFEKKERIKINKKNGAFSVILENSLARKGYFNLVMFWILNFSKLELGFSINRFANSLPILLKFYDFSFNGYILIPNSLPITSRTHFVNKM